jgi:hypothetical protein
MKDGPWKKGELLQALRKGGTVREEQPEQRPGSMKVGPGFTSLCQGLG